jgi:hypothetical protein
MRFYPALPSRRLAMIAADLAVVLLLCLFAWLGVRVHDGIAELAGVGRGLEDSGHAIASTATDYSTGVNGAFNSAGNAVGGIPIVGGQLSGALRNAGRSATQPVQQAANQQAAKLVAAGREQEAKTYRLAKLIGWLTFILPTILLLSRALPWRIGRIARMTAAHRALRHGAPSELLAARAAYNLPFRVLVRHTTDPFGDLAAGYHAPLLAALAEDAGVKLPPPPSAPRVDRYSMRQPARGS